MKKILIIQTSLNPESKTQIACNKTLEIGKEKGFDIEILNLKEFKMEFCDGRKIEDYNQDIQKIKEIIEKVDSYILAYPIYNYSYSGVCKNFIDMFSYFMDSKKVGIIYNSYSLRSFSDGFAEIVKVLGLHNNIEVVLPAIHTCNEDFDSNELVGEKAVEKIGKLLDKLN